MTIRTPGLRGYATTLGFGIKRRWRRDRMFLKRWSHADVTIARSGIFAPRVLYKEPGPLLKGIEEQTHAYLVGACKNLESPSLIVGGVEDHLHILLRQSKNIALKDLVAELKRESSKWIKLQGDSFAKFYWQGGYGAFSISPAHIERLTNYIATQREHHTKVTL